MAEPVYVAAQLAARDFTGPTTIFEGPKGFFRSFCGEGNYELDVIDAKLGEEFDISLTMFKPYACGGGIHPVLTAVDQLRAEHSIAPDQVSRVVVRTSRHAVDFFCTPWEAKVAPVSGSQAQHSMPFAVAVLMTLGLSDVFAGGLAAWRELPGLGLVLDRIPAPDSREVPAAPDSREAAAGHAPRPPGHQPRSADREPGPGDRRDAGRPLGARAPRLDSLRLEGISVGWGREPVLTDLDLHADRRHWTVVVGDSGSGKSTTLSVLLRFLDPWVGTYLATTPAGDSVDVLGFDPAALAGRVAWCPQEAHVFRSTVRGNLAIARAVAPSETEMCTALERAGLAEWADRDGLDRWVGDHGADISGGQRQRLAVARTILSGADVIVLDEPTAHLDRDTAQSLLTHLRESLADHTVVLVTHDRGLIEADDRVIDLGSRRLSPVSSRT